MKTPKPNDHVKYVGKLFPELEQETYTIVMLLEKGMVELFGRSSYRLIKKHRIDIGLVKEV